MRKTANKPPDKPPNRPSIVTHDGRQYPLLWEARGWRLRSKSKKRPVDFRTGALNLTEAKRRAKEWLERHEDEPTIARRGGGSLERLAEVYKETPKRTQSRVAKNNVSRLRVICRTVLKRELADVTCREVSPELWQNYQRAALKAMGHEFNLTTRYAENTRINAAVRAARCLFLPALLRTYKTFGLAVRPDAGQAVMLPMPYVPRADVDDDRLIARWSPLPPWRPIDDQCLWLTIGLARFAGLRRDEISHARVGWVEEEDDVVSIYLRDRPEEKWWTKTGRPYRAQVMHESLAAWLRDYVSRNPPDALLIQEHARGATNHAMTRHRWFEREPQRWLKDNGFPQKGKSLHRLRGLYADHVATFTQDAVTAKLAAVKAAQTNLGHTSAKTTKDAYLKEGLRG